MPGQSIPREMRLCTRATHNGTVEIIFLGKVIALELDQARELQRELTHSIGIAAHGRPRLNTHDRPELVLR